MIIWILASAQILDQEALTLAQETLSRLDFSQNNDIMRLTQQPSLDRMLSGMGEVKQQIEALKQQVAVLLACLTRATTAQLASEGRGGLSSLLGDREKDELQSDEDILWAALSSIGSIGQDHVKNTVLSFAQKKYPLHDVLLESFQKHLKEWVAEKRAQWEGQGGTPGIAPQKAPSFTISQEDFQEFVSERLIQQIKNDLKGTDFYGFVYGDDASQSQSLATELFDSLHPSVPPEGEEVTTPSEVDDDAQSIATTSPPRSVTGTHRSITSISSRAIEQIKKLEDLPQEDWPAIINFFQSAIIASIVDKAWKEGLLPIAEKIATISKDIGILKAPKDKPVSHTKAFIEGMVQAFGSAFIKEIITPLLQKAGEIHEQKKIRLEQKTEQICQSEMGRSEIGSRASCGPTQLCFTGPEPDTSIPPVPEPTATSMLLTREECRAISLPSWQVIKQLNLEAKINQIKKVSQEIRQIFDEVTQPFKPSSGELFGTFLRKNTITAEQIKRNEAEIQEIIIFLSSLEKTLKEIKDISDRQITEVDNPIKLELKPLDLEE